MPIFKLLGRQQREIQELLGDIKLAVASSQHELARVTFQLVSHKLIAYMRAEHEVVYPMLADLPELVDEIALARKEHAVIEQVINVLRVGGLQGAPWLRMFDELATLVASHAAFEAHSLFPVARRMLAPAELAELRADFDAHLAWSTPVAGASITYEPAPCLP